MEALRIEEELEKQMLQPKLANLNRHSKDSGVVDIELLKPLDLSSAVAANNNNKASSEDAADNNVCGQLSESMFTTAEGQSVLAVLSVNGLLFF